MSNEELKEFVMEQMELKLDSKYDLVCASDVHEINFDVYDLTKGSNKSWFQYGVYPATAVSLLYEDDDREFQVRIKTDGKNFGKFEDNFYGILYGDAVKEELENLIMLYPLLDATMEYEPSEEILREETNLRKHLVLMESFHVSDSDDLDEICELLDELNRLGYQHRLTVHNDTKENNSFGITNISSKELRRVFQDL